jgi:hypothetical protein
MTLFVILPCVLLVVVSIGAFRSRRNVRFKFRSALRLFEFEFEAGAPEPPESPTGPGVRGPAATIPKGKDNPAKPRASKRGPRAAGQSSAAETSVVTGANSSPALLEPKAQT